MKNQALIISIHDVSPRTQAAVEEILRDLQQCGVERCSLLVIPNHHHVGWLSEFPLFVAWLKEKQKEGHEIVLHGLYHLRPQRQADGFFARCITQCYTAGEGEFFDLSYEEAVQKLREGRAELETIGFLKEEVVGFIAPAWLLSAAAEKALHDEDFSYTTRLGGIIDLRKNPSKFYPSQSMVYSVRSAWRRTVSLLWNEILFRYAKKWPVLRLGLHPPDWKHGSIRKHALATVRRALCHRSVITYGAWLCQASKEKEIHRDRSDGSDGK